MCVVVRGHPGYIPGYHRWVWIMQTVCRMWSTGDILDIIRSRGFRCMWIMQGGKTELVFLLLWTSAHRSLLLWLGSVQIRCVLFFRVIIMHVFYSCRRGWKSHSGGTAVLTLSWAVVYPVFPDKTHIIVDLRHRNNINIDCPSTV